MDDAAACVASLNDLLRRYGFKPVSLEEYRSDFGFPVRDYYVRLGFDFDRHDWNRIAVDFFEFYDTHERKAGLRKGAKRVLDLLRDRNVPMSILSASEINILERMVRDRGIGGYFRELYGRADTFAGSKVDIGKTLAAKIEADASEILLIGDTIHDHEVAEAMDCECVLMCGGHQSCERLTSTGRIVLADMPALEEYLNGALLSL